MRLRTSSSLSSAARWTAARAASSGWIASPGSSTPRKVASKAASMSSPITSSMMRASPGAVAAWYAPCLRESANRALVSRKMDSSSFRARRSRSSRCRHGMAKSSALKKRSLPKEDSSARFSTVSLLVGCPAILISSLTMRSYTCSSNARGMSPDSPSVELAMRTKSSLDIRDPAIAGLCASVLSMIAAKARMYAISSCLKTSGQHLQYRAANASMMRSIFCASPGNRN
mmetsp:Transcript_5116/g.17817  ORF Transcript_5116/g.17817 Transcript_5116/m.17817 type:complete len:229 (-) Transcript_5116:659-1345(-)